MKPGRAHHLRITQVLLLILIGVSVLPLWFYGSKMTSMNREKLETQETVLQTTTSQFLARVISLFMESQSLQVRELLDTVLPIASRLRASEYPADPNLRIALEHLVAERPGVLYATVLNDEARGRRAGNFDAAQDTFLRNTLEAAFVAAHQGQEYQSNPITVVRSHVNEPVMVMAQPIQVKGQFLGMVAAVVTLAPIMAELQQVNQQAGLEAYVVDNAGRLVASYNPDQVAGMDMSDAVIVGKFLAWRGHAMVAETSLFNSHQGGKAVPMLGTYSPTQKLGWGVIVQRKQSDAFYIVSEMRRQTWLWGAVVVILSLVVGIPAARAITRPIEQLTQTARSFAQRNFAERTDVRSRIMEVAELGEGFNLAGEEIQHYISELQAASEQNRQLFIESIEALAATVDAKDPYTRGHSSRVSQYSAIVARELGLSEEEVDKIRVSAILHDIGKIGIPEPVLLKPGVLTDEEFEIMKRHTVKGCEIVRQIHKLDEMLPGIRWHHEAMNGQGYPDGLEGDKIPLMARIVAVADTFDAVTTERPYQAGADFPKALDILVKRAGSRFDPAVVDALRSAYTKGNLRKLELRYAQVEGVPQPAS
jgi:putative nucleotidyltransferase with HDIG domain